MNKNDTESIVKEFLDLWQKQFLHTSKEGDAIYQNLENFAKMQEAYMEAVNQGLGNISNAESATTSDIFRNISNEFSKLAKSYAKLEERIANLESQITEQRQEDTGKAPKNTKSKSRKGTTKTDS